MDKALLLILIICHFLGDYYLQSERMAEGKRNSYKKILIHGAIYQGVFIIPVIIFRFSLNVVGIVLIIGVLHLIIDTLKMLLENKLLDNSKGKTKDYDGVIIFIIDQLLHLVVIVFLALTFSGNNLAPYPFLNVPIIVIRWIAAVIFIGKPANIIFRNCFKRYKPIEKSGEDNKLNDNEADAKVKDISARDNKAGSIIGILERLLMLIFILNSLMTSIAIVFTAKSIARYNKIGSCPAFADYYLIGTLSSVLLTLFSYWLFFIAI